MPFVKAWNFLKASRQTELGEFHPDFPSSYGPVKYFHGTPSKNRLSFLQRGIEARPTLVNGVGNTKAAFVARDPFTARGYAGGDVYEDDRVPGQIIGVRKKIWDGYDPDMGYAYDLADIPPQYLTQMPEEYHDLRGDRAWLYGLMEGME